MSDIPKIENGDDVPLWGAGPIAKIINRSERQTYYLLEHGLIPARKVGELWVTTRRAALSAILPRTDAE